MTEPPASDSVNGLQVGDRVRVKIAAAGVYGRINLVEPWCGGDLFMVKIDGTDVEAGYREADLEKGDPEPRRLVLPHTRAYGADTFGEVRRKIAENFEEIAKYCRAVGDEYGEYPTGLQEAADEVERFAREVRP